MHSDGTIRQLLRRLQAIEARLPPAPPQPVKVEAWREPRVIDGFIEVFIYAELEAGGSEILRMWLKDEEFRDRCIPELWSDARAEIGRIRAEESVPELRPDLAAGRRPGERWIYMSEVDADGHEEYWSMRTGREPNRSFYVNGYANERIPDEDDDPLALHL